MVAHKAHDVGIVKVVILKEGDSGLCSLDFFGSMYYHLFLSWFSDFDVFTNNHLWTQIEYKTYNETQTNLADNLELAMQTFLVLLEDLNVVIGKA